MHWKTLKKVLEHSKPPGYRQGRQRPKRKIGPFEERVRQILKEDKALPASVVELRRQAFAASGFFFATPEYNGFTSAVLKNAIDWLSRAGPEGASPLKGKPFAIVRRLRTKRRGSARTRERSPLA